MRRSSYFAAILALAVASTAAAQRDPLGSSSMARQHDPSQPKEVQEARAFQNLKVPGHKVSRAVKKVRKLKWYSSLTAAGRRARVEKKPIVWIQALGTLKGQT